MLEGRPGCCLSGPAPIDKVAVPMTVRNPTCGAQDLARDRETADLYGITLRTAA